MNTKLLPLAAAAALALPGCASVLGIDDVEVVVAISDLRAGPPGPVDVVLEGAVVTYVDGRRFYLQSERAGPAIEVFNGPDALAEEIAVGAVLDLHVSEIGAFRDNEQISGFEVLAVDPTPFDVEALKQDLSATSAELSEELEAEAVRLSSATVEAAEGDGLYQVSYGTAQGQMFLPGIAAELPAGCVFRLAAGVVVSFDGVHQILSTDAADFTAVSDCSL